MSLDTALCGLALLWAAMLRADAGQTGQTGQTGGSSSAAAVLEYQGTVSYTGDTMRRSDCNVSHPPDPHSQLCLNTSPTVDGAGVVAQLIFDDIGDDEAPAGADDYDWGILDWWEVENTSPDVDGLVAELSELNLDAAAGAGAAGAGAAGAGAAGAGAAGAGAAAGPNRAARRAALKAHRLDGRLRPHITLTAADPDSRSSTDERLRSLVVCDSAHEGPALIPSPKETLSQYHQYYQQQRNKADEHQCFTNLVQKLKCVVHGSECGRWWMRDTGRLAMFHGTSAHFDGDFPSQRVNWLTFSPYMAAYFASKDRSHRRRDGAYAHDNQHRRVYVYHTKPDGVLANVVDATNLLRSKAPSGSGFTYLPTDHGLAKSFCSSGVRAWVDMFHFNNDIRANECSIMFCG